MHKEVGLLNKQFCETCIQYPNRDSPLTLLRKWQCHCTADLLFALHVLNEQQFYLFRHIQTSQTGHQVIVQWYFPYGECSLTDATSIFPLKPFKSFRCLSLDVNDLSYAEIFYIDVSDPFYRHQKSNFSFALMCYELWTTICCLL